MESLGIGFRDISCLCGSGNHHIIGKDRMEHAFRIECCESILSFLQAVCEDRKTEIAYAISFTYSLYSLEG